MRNADFEYIPRAYDTPERLYSYGFQIQEIFNYDKPLTNVTVLNIGSGGGFLKNYLSPLLQETGRCYNIDIGAETPDIHSSVTDLPFVSSCADIVVCTQVLQYLPFEQVPGALKEIHRVAKPGGKVILSLPNAGWHLFFKVRLPAINFSKLCSFGLPTPGVTDETSSTYPGYWEINRGGHSLSMVRQMVTEHFVLTRDYRLPKHPYHHFLILAKGT